MHCTHSQNTRYIYIYIYTTTRIYRQRQNKEKKTGRPVETGTPLIHICLLFFLLSAAQIPQRGGKYKIKSNNVLHLRFIPS